MSFNGLSGNAKNNTGDFVPTSILPSKDSAGAIRVISDVSFSPAGTVLLSGALTATVYKELVSLSTPGILRLCGIVSEYATSRTLGLKVIIDGVVVFDEVSSAITTAREGFFAVGNTYFRNQTSTPAATAEFESFGFNSSLSILVKSSITETDKVSLQYLTAI